MFAEIASLKCVSKTSRRDCRDTRGSIREDSVRLRLQALKRAKSTFDLILGADEYLRICCAGDDKCIGKMKAIKFLTTAENQMTGVDSLSTVSYDSVKDALITSVAYLTDSYTEDNIDAIVIHELGHACLTHRLGHQPPRCQGKWKMTVTTRPEVIDVYEREFLRTFPEPVAKCLMPAVKKAGQDFNNDNYFEKACLAQMLNEAFAETVFFSNLNTLGHWPPLFGLPADMDHGPRKPLLECMLRDKTIRTSWCQRQQKVEDGGLH